MDLLKEIQELKQAIQDALEDGRISFLEAVKIFREFADVFALVLPLIIGEISKAETKAEQSA
jgi:hypothetical protein